MNNTTLGNHEELNNTQIENAIHNPTHPTHFGKSRTKLKALLIMTNLTPPLPLIQIPNDKLDQGSSKTRGEFDYEFPYIKHAHIPANKICPIGDPEICKQLARYMADVEKRYWKKSMQLSKQVLVFKRPSRYPVQRQQGPGFAANGNNYCNAADDATTLKFCSWFESGNLDRAYRIYGRSFAHFPSVTPPEALRDSNIEVRVGSHQQDHSRPQQVDQEYDLYCENDTYTLGNIQWYYFRVQVPSSFGSFKVRFNIRNMMKTGSLYNMGMLPAVYSEVNIFSTLTLTGKII